MQFRLSTLLLLFVVLWSSLAVFGWPGGLIFVLLTGLAICVARSWRVWSGVICFLLLMIAFALPAGLRFREMTLRIHCLSRMKQISLGLLNYASVHHCLPPAHFVDKNGRRNHSWRTMLLPHIESTPLYSQFDFNEPWDSAKNKALLSGRFTVYACPCDPVAASPSSTSTSYVAVVGSNAAWAGEKSRTFAELAPLSNTILLVEAAGSNIEWTEPRDFDIDLPLNSPNRLTLSGRHRAGSDFFHYTDDDRIMVAMADGSLRELPGEFLDAKKYPDVFKIGGCKDEYFDPSWTKKSRRIHWPNCLALAVWLGSVGLLIGRGYRSRKELSAEDAEDAEEKGRGGEDG
jgi:hypothetical protein